MSESSSRSEFPEIPSKRYFTIGEASELCGVKPHALRYWEQEFPQLKPLKRRGNRRYYQPQDVILIRQIRSLLYEQGFSIGDAREQLVQEEGKGASGLLTMLAHVIHLSEETSPEEACKNDAIKPLRQRLPAFCDYVAKLNRLSQEQSSDVDEPLK